jgi:hypothetical protein
LFRQPPWPQHLNVSTIYIYIYIYNL